MFKITSLRSFFSNGKYFLDTSLVNAVARTENKPGSFATLSKILYDQGAQITYFMTHLLDKRIGQKIEYQLDFTYERDDKIIFQQLKQALAQKNIFVDLQGPVTVPWFPRNLSEIDLIGKVLLEVNEDKSVHEAFTDADYRKRRNQIAEIALNYKMGQAIPNVNYSQEETDLWCRIYDKLSNLHSISMSSRFLKQIKFIQKQFKIRKRIPQLNELSSYLEQKTGFRIKPTHGILSQRQFLNAFAFKLFCSTQYIRHWKTPDYTPEPDIVHEIVGHVPMFADPQVASISHKIGLLSLGASDQLIAMLGALYWFTLEFGVCKEGDKKLGYGAGIASSIGQIEHMLSQKAQFKAFQPKKDCLAKYPVQTVQNLFRVTQSFEQSLKDLTEFGRSVRKPITTIYNQRKKSIQFDRNIEAVFTEDEGLKF